MAQPPRRSRRLQGLAPRVLSFETDVPLASLPASVDPLEVVTGSPSFYGLEVRSESYLLSPPIPHPSGIHIVEFSDSDTVRPDFSAFSFNPLFGESSTDLSSGAGSSSVNQRPTRSPYLFHFNQPLTDPSGPIVQELTEPSASPWRSNTWYQQILRDSEPVPPVARTASSLYSTPTMFVFENDDFPLQEENYGDNTNLMENTQFTWSNTPYVPFREPMIRMHPRLTTMVDQGSQYVDPTLPPLVGPMTSSGRHTPPMMSAHTQTDLPFERLVVSDN